MVSPVRDAIDYWRYLGWLNHAVSQLPHVVLDHLGPASVDSCLDMQEELAGFEQLCQRLELDDHCDFINACRWHLKHYALFTQIKAEDYADYIREQQGPLRVFAPVSPPWLHRRKGALDKV